ncbi:MAG: head GIN domain-containing protein [Bacteroidia bacterium]
MKKSLAFSLIIAFMLVMGACSKDGHRCIKGKGSIVSRDFSIQPFDRFSYFGSGDIYITQGAATTMRIEGQQNILEELDIDNTGGELRIGKNNCFRGHKDITIHITTPSLISVSLSGSSTLRGIGTFESTSFQASISGSGDADLNIFTEHLVADISGSGSMRFGGSAGFQHLNISGSGSMHAFALEGEEADIDVSGSGECEVNVSQKLKVRISGSGDVYYKGNPVIESDISGSGKLVRVN